jgi:hypothetical protein
MMTIGLPHRSPLGVGPVRSLINLVRSMETLPALTARLLMLMK